MKACIDCSALPAPLAQSLSHHSAIIQVVASPKTLVVTLTHTSFERQQPVKGPMWGKTPHTMSRHISLACFRISLLECLWGSRREPIPD